MPQPNKFKRRDFDFEVKAVDEKGFFSGYASVWGVLDFYHEQVAQGAFSKSLAKWKTKGRLPPALWQHDWRDPVGPFLKMVEDERGLYTEGQLLIDDVVRAREARALMIAKAVTGMSIGFDPIVDEYNKDTKILTLKEVDLWETSIVTFPALEVAQIESVKTIIARDGELPSLKDFEGLLRDVGFSRTQAKAIVTKGYASLRREVGETKVDARSILDDVFASKQPSITLKELGL